MKIFTLPVLSIALLTLPAAAVAIQDQQAQSQDEYNSYSPRPTQHQSNMLTEDDDADAKDDAWMTTNNWEDESMDAWLDGKAEATLLFNGELNSFAINTDVKDKIVTLTGMVQNDVEKSLAEELVRGIEGVKEVNNKLEVARSEGDEDSGVMSAMTDAKIKSVIISRFLLSSEISGMDIDVDVEDTKVTLSGDVDSVAQSDLARTIAENANDVTAVENKLNVKKGDA